MDKKVKTNTKSKPKANVTSAAEAVVDALIEEGIEYVFGITGDTVLPLLDAMYHRSDKIKYITCRQELGATSAADAYSRVTGKMGACLFHVGPSISNTVMGVWSANKDYVPLLIMSANMDTFRLGRNIWHEFDVMGVMEKVTKWNDQLGEAKDTRRIMRTAFQMATSGMPGVVHLDFPKDLLPHPVQVESTDASLKGGAHNKKVANAIRPAAGAVEDAVALIQKAKNPLILAGRDVLWSRASKDLVAAAERLGVPVITTEMGRGSIPETHPLAGGLVGHFGHSTANRLIREADLVMGLGCRFHNVSTINWSLISENARIIQVEPDPLEIGRQYAVDLGIHANAGAFLTDLLAHCEEKDIHGDRKTREKREAQIADLKADQDKRFYDTDLDAVPIKPQLIAKAIQEVCEDDAIYCIGAGLHTQWAHAIPITHPDQYHLAAGSGSMAWALPAGIGAKLARPDRQVVVPVGDGDFGMNAQELETSVREKAPVICIVYNDQSYGALRVFQQNVYGGRIIGSEYGDTDLVKLAEAYGARGERVDQPKDLVPALKRATESDVTTVIDARIDGWEPHYREKEWGEFHKF